MIDKNHKSDIDWLIITAVENDIVEIKEEAIQELKLRGFSQKDIDLKYIDLKDSEKQIETFNRAWDIQLYNNQFEKYTRIENLKIFLFGPYKLLKSFDSGLIYLYKNNYIIKFRQRLLLVILGIAFWIGVLIGIYRISQYQRMKQAEKVDISDWERNRIENE
jgi:hypothetical protein